MYLASWSGGKDSCFACYQAGRSGRQVSGLLNCVSRENGRVSFHGVDPELVRAQADLLGMRLLQQETTPERYADEFKQGVRALTSGRDISGMIFGDIYLDEHLRWVEGICRDLGIQALEPLWGRDTGELVRDFIDAGFRAVIIAGKADCIEREWIGRTLDHSFLEYLSTRPEVDPCGERGEYHTLVVGGPLFRGEIIITASEVVERDGYRFLDIQGFTVNEAARTGAERRRENPDREMLHRKQVTHLLK